MLRFFVGFFCCLFIALTSGFFTFTAYVQTPFSYHIDKPLDAGVVFTGDRDRIDTGFRLLHSQKIKKLLISGVRPSSSIKQILSYRSPLYPIDSNTIDCCVALDRKATNTIENIEQTLLWVDSMKVQSLALVTSDYHLPRSRLLFFLNNTKVRIYPYSVKSKPVLPFDATTFSEYGTKMLYEYIKLILTAIMLTPSWAFSA